MSPEPAKERPRTRIQREKQDMILEAALNVFSAHGFRGTTIDQIAEAAGMSKPNLLYYFASKEAIHRELLTSMLDLWLDPLRELDAEGDPMPEIRSYIRRKLEMARDFPRESRLFANEMLQGAPHAVDVHILQSEGLPGGIGEPGVPPASAAICNAIYSATKVRIRQLPVAKQLAGARSRADGAGER